MKNIFTLKFVPIHFYSSFFDVDLHEKINIHGNIHIAAWFVECSRTHLYYVDLFIFT